VAIFEPARQNYFGVMLWDVQGSVVANARSSRSTQVASDIASGIVGGEVALTGNLLYGGFSKVTGLTVGLDFETYSEGGNNDSPRYFHKSGKYEAALTLSRGASPRTDLWDWHQQVLHGEAPAVRKSGLVILLDRGKPLAEAPAAPAATGPTNPRQVSGEGAVDELKRWARMPLAAWYISRALPEKVELGGLDAATEAVLYETVTLKHEGVTRVSLSMIPGLGDFGTILGGAFGTGTGALLSSLATVAGR
jgi:phage tail-like protein